MSIEIPCHALIGRVIRIQMYALLQGDGHGRICGTLIPHASPGGLSLPTPTLALCVAVIEPASLALPMPSVRSATALVTSGLRASWAAVDLAAVAGATKSELLATASTDQRQESLRSVHRRDSINGRTRGDPGKMRESGRRTCLPSASRARPLEGPER